MEIIASALVLTPGAEGISWGAAVTFSAVVVIRLYRIP
jgi:hypothetical protein